MELRIVIWLALGAILGVAASLLRGPAVPRRVPLNVAVGIVGAVFGGSLMAPIVGMGTGSHAGVEPGALFVSFLWASILLAFTNLFRTKAAP